jgi:hypothetical protein
MGCRGKNLTCVEAIFDEIEPLDKAERKNMV